MSKQVCFGNKINKTRLDEMNIFKAYSSLKYSSIPVGIMEVFKMKRSKGDFDAIIYSLIIHKQAQLRCDYRDIINHWKDGGNPLNVVHGLIAAVSTNKKMSIGKAIKKDLDGVDISKKIIGIGWRQRMKEIMAEQKK